jgi:CobQ-like glutamine amidotransferase family enzyme
MSADFTIVSLYPHMLGTYGDGGNATVLLQRAFTAGMRPEVVEVGALDPVPELADVYLLGGGEDQAQVAACERLRAWGGLSRAVARGASVLGVCAGFQLLGETYAVDGGQVPGLGLLDVTSDRLRRRAVGNIAVVRESTDAGGPPSGLLLGFENHAGSTMCGSDAQPFGRVAVGIGNGDGVDGAVNGRVVGTYLHGPVLARNPSLADWLLGLPASAGGHVDERDALVAALRAERVEHIPTGRRTRAELRRLL